MIYPITAGALVLAAVVLSSGAAAAEPCPKAQVVGSDPALVEDVQNELKARQIPTATVSDCRPLVVAVERDAARVKLVVTDGDFVGRSRIVASPATAASLVLSWTNTVLDDLSWTFPEPKSPATAAAPAAVLAAEPPREPTASITVDAPPPGVSAAHTWWVAAIGAASEGGTLGGGVTAAFELRDGTWWFGPAARLQIDRQSSTDERAGGRSLEAAIGGVIGMEWAAGPVRVAPHLGALPTYRFITPNASVGPIPCAPSDPCSVDNPPPGPASSFHALTVWTEIGLNADVPIGDGVTFGAGLTLAGAPTYVSIDAPVVLPARDARDRVRDLPRLPRWRALMQVGFRWGGA